MHNNKYLTSVAMPRGGGGKGVGAFNSIRIIQTDTVTLT